MRILLLRPDKAGDAIKTLPVLRALVKQVQEEITVLCSSHNESLFEFEPNVKTIRASAEPVRESYDIAINLLCDPSEDSLEWLGKVQAAKRYSVLPPGSEWPHITRLQLPNNSPANRDETLNIALLVSQALGQDLSIRLREQERAPMLSSKDRVEAETKMGKKAGLWVGVCPFAGLAHRSHSLSRWRNFVATIVKSKAFDRVFVFGAPIDTEALAKFRGAAPCQPSSFRALGAYFEHLDGVIAVDSGPLHLAQAMGKSHLGFLSGGDASRWFAPKHPNSKIVLRGLLSRQPSLLEMNLYLRKWLQLLT